MKKRVIWKSFESGGRKCGYASSAHTTLESEKLSSKYSLNTIKLFIMWAVEIHHEFKAEFENLDIAAQDAIAARVLLLKKYGPNLGRPYADTLSRSKYANMKELRCSISKGEWRVAFAFDAERKAILLVAGNKLGAKKNQFYKQLIAIADKRFKQHLISLSGRK